MREFEIVTDSCCDLPISYVNEKKINIVNLTCIFDEKEYIDDLGKSLSFKFMCFIRPQRYNKQCKHGKRNGIRRK